MHNLMLTRKKSLVIVWLTRGLLIVLMIVFVGAGIWYLKAIIPTPAPTPTPDLPAVVRLNGVLLDSDRRVKGEWRGEQIPELIAETDTLYTGYIIEGGGIAETITFITTLKELDLAVTQATLYNEDYIELHLDDGVLIRYAKRRDPIQTAYTIQEMYSIFSIEGDMPHIIDVRFQKPTIIN